MRSLLVLLLLGSTAFAENAYLPQVEMDEQIDTARVQRGAGVALTIAGAAMAVGAIHMGGYALHDGGLPIDCGPDVACQRDQPTFQAAVGLAVTSSVLMSVGIPLWAVGSDKVKKLEKRARVSGFFSKNSGGAEVRVSF